jgi:hypothetical protein
MQARPSETLSNSLRQTSILRFLHVSRKPASALVLALASKIHARPGKLESVTLPSPFRFGFGSDLRVWRFHCYPAPPKSMLKHESPLFSISTEVGLEVSVSVQKAAKGCSRPPDPGRQVWKIIQPAPEARGLRAGEYKLNCAPDGVSRPIAPLDRDIGTEN